MYSLKRLPILVPVLFSLSVAACVLAGCGMTSDLAGLESAHRAALDTVRAGRFDGGRMWTFEDPPTNWLREAYGFSPDERWLDDVRMSALRFASWCSASFVSADGLVMTNHHCARTSLVAVQRDGEDLFATGFSAGRPEDERRVPDLFVDQLVEIRDVTARVQRAMDAAATDEGKVDARAKEISAVEREASDETKLRAQVVTLYAGGKYSLYLYRRYTDVRLVAAPEFHLAHFGGEFDNFTYPRYALDFSFFRVYGGDGKPLHTEHFFRWSAAGAKEGEATFVIGNPGRTSRLNTVAQLEYNRDVQYPFIARILDERMETLEAYVREHPEKRDDMRTQILSVANSRKAYAGRLAGLRDDRLMQRRRDFERTFRAKVDASSALVARYGKVWDDIARSREAMRAIANDALGLRTSGLGVAGFVTRAYALVKLSSELDKPEAERDEPYRADALAKTRESATRFTPLDADLETLTLAHQLALIRDRLGAGDPLAALLLRGETPSDAARRLVRTSVLNDSSAFAALAADRERLTASGDPFVAFAHAALPRIDRAEAVSREVRAADAVHNAALGRALFEMYGTAIPPDATFTLRLADGVVKGYDYNGTRAPAITTFYGLYDRWASFGEDSWSLPDRWRHPPADFDPATPYDVCATNDIIGGNSGSAMINRDKQIVGLVFDGNMESLPGDYIFAEDAGNRTVAVHSAGILEALRHIMRADRVFRELEHGRMAAEEGAQQ